MGGERLALSGRSSSGCRDFRGRAKNPDHLRRDASALAPLAW
jgi:hypothetical protein